MKTRLRGYRTVIIAGIGLLFLLLMIMGFGLYSQLSDLATADDDNTQWSISQLDIEFANLQVALSQQPDSGVYNDRDINLRFDIALSRLGILTSGRSAAFFAGNDSAQMLIASITELADEAIAVVEEPGALTATRVQNLLELTLDIRPDVRKVALLGVDIHAERSIAQRAAFSRQLIRTGSAAILLMILMGGLMLLLDRLLVRAARRDAELLTSSKLLKSTISASLDAIVTSNEAGEIIEYNAAAEDVFGWTRDEIIGLTMKETFIPEHMREAHHAGMNRFLATGVPRVVGGGRVELSALRKTGEEFPVALNITSVADENGTKFIAYIQDISERKINEQKLIDARDRAEQTDKAKSQFLTVMSHEMRTPLNGIMGVLDLLRTTELTEQQDRYSRIAAASSEILLGHINEALDVTRIETGSFHLTPQNFDLESLITSVVEVLEPLAREKQLVMSLRIDNAMRSRFYGDSNRIRQILTNLVGNAIKFTDNGNVTIDVTGIHAASETSLRISIEDTGAGIDATQHEQIFENFVALAHSEGRQSRGDGLGLSISRRIARQLGGDISVQSEVNMGSIFTLAVPLKRQDMRRKSVANTPQTEPHNITHTMHILVVEDNDINRSVLCDLLKGLGHSVTEAINGADCLEQAKKRPFDLIFMDISMPVMDGIEATQRLRTGNGPNMRTHIVGLTAHGYEEYREKGNQAGMSRFHTKPIRLASLRAILSEAATEVSKNESSSAILPSELAELCTMLGKDKVEANVDMFFDEFQSFLAEMRTATPFDDVALEDATHKQIGAASLLGQHELATRLSDLEDIARQGPVKDLGPWASELVEIATRSQAAFTTAIADSTSE
ncbi:hybrid sensor histidine kinase/response regulator [Octadecabacter ascidiaceicola]|uniref:histidine kinase n=1 Tax=Octadecabacter ascidiaceicola TaxID=1655543 RepID=A0A238K727_9RHOB|nr:ATP-binding protein [Octadecabacter ascidiaceicola]SMX38244.1 Sensor protein EvgS precursor [Octadecabacter ascidiaceicola]